MANIFSQDNPFNDLMSTIGDMAMISVAWTVCSHPHRNDRSVHIRRL